MKTGLQRLLLILAVLGVTLFFHAPRLWIMSAPMPGTYQWDRAMQFQAQATDPMAPGIEPALRWRLLPAYAAHGLGLERNAIFIFPALGVLALLFYVFTRVEQLGLDRNSALAVIALLSSSSAVLVPLHWWGMNDAWAWLALAVVVLDPSRTALVSACLLGPWIDERFLIALPLAWLCRWLTLRRPTLGEWLSMLPGPVIYLCLRFWAWSAGAHHDPSSAFLSSHLQMTKDWIPYAPLAWWLAWRAAWALPLLALISLWMEERFKAVLGLASLGATALVMIPLAADLSRSAALVLPAVLGGAILIHRRFPKHALTTFTAVAALNLLIPAAHVVYNKIDLISPLPIELVRLWRFPAQLPATSPND